MVSPETLLTPARVIESLYKDLKIPLTDYPNDVYGMNLIDN
jgi:hypothetical protein